MRYFTTRGFWKLYYKLPAYIQQLADENFELLRNNPRHPSLHLKKVGRHWSARVGTHYRTLGVESPEGLVWYWIGTHAEYDKLIN